MAFTDVEMAILSQLAYSGATEEVNRKSNPSTAPKRDDKLYDLILENEEWLEAKLGDGYKDAIKQLKDKTKNSDYTIVLTADNKVNTGFAAFAVRDPDNNVTVACRGTEGLNTSTDSLLDWKNNIESAYSLQNTQQEEMERFMQALESDGYAGYYFTGHSLGGNLAMYGAIFLNDPSKLLGCVTFNAPGFNAAFLDKNQFRISQIEDRVKSFQNEGDMVSECFVVIGDVIILECVGWASSDIWGIDQHSLNALIINDDGSFKKNHNGKKDVNFGSFLADRLTDDTDGVMAFLSPVILAYDYMKWKNERAKNIYRDFSDEAKQMLVGAAKETEDEHWWEVSKWDCWYKVEKFFGTLEWDLYAGNVDNYYRKLIDINDASVKDIEKIFENVYTLDRSYSNTINTATDTLRTKVTNTLKALRESIIIT